MTSRSLLVVGLASVTLSAFCFSVVNCGSLDFACPDVKDMYCPDSDNVNATCRTETFIKMPDGSECPSCDRCFEPWQFKDVSASVPVGQGYHCPVIICSVWREPANCNPEFYDTWARINGEVCQICVTFVCK